MRVRAAMMVICLFGLIGTCVSQDKDFIERSGDIGQIFIPASAGLASLLLEDDLEGSEDLALSLASTFVLTHGLKRLINKPRPNGGNYAWPSGHTSISFASAAFLQKRYGWQFGIPAYSLASYVAWTRIDAGKHDWSDVVAGAVLGTVMAHVFTDRLEESGVDVGVGLGGVVVRIGF